MCRLAGISGILYTFWMANRVTYFLTVPRELGGDRWRELCVAKRLTRDIERKTGHAGPAREKSYHRRRPARPRSSSVTVSRIPGSFSRSARYPSPRHVSVGGYSLYDAIPRNHDARIREALLSGLRRSRIT